MESITVSYLNHFPEAVRSRSAFLHSSFRYKRNLLVSFIVVWLGLLILDLNAPHPFLGIEVRWGISSFSLISRAIEVTSEIILCAIPAGICIGLAVLAQNYSVERVLARLPAQSFGLMTVTISPTGLVILAPLSKTELDWKNHFTLQVTADYLFIISGTFHVISIPIPAFGIRLSEFIQSFQVWSTQPAKTDGEASTAEA